MKIIASGAITQTSTISFVDENNNPITVDPNKYIVNLNCGSGSWVHLNNGTYHNYGGAYVSSKGSQSVTITYAGDSGDFPTSYDVIQIAN